MSTPFTPDQPFKTFVLDTQTDGDDRIGPYSIAYIGQPHAKAVSDVAEFLLIGEAYDLETGGVVQLERCVTGLTDRGAILEHFAMMCGHFVLFFWLKAEHHPVEARGSRAIGTEWALGNRRFSPHLGGPVT